MSSRICGFTTEWAEPASPFCGGLRHGIDRGDAFPSSPINDGAFTSSAEDEAQLWALSALMSLERPGVSCRRHLSAAQFFHACSDCCEIVNSAGSALAAQLLHARSDRRKIVSGAGSGHVSSVSWRIAGTTFEVQRGPSPELGREQFAGRDGALVLFNVPDRQLAGL